jgi:dihydroorotate dehydrogenase electron transfer subunit
MPPADVQAEVVANRRLSADYHVLTLAAPAIAEAVRPGQFVMVKTAPGLDPLLRRPFSVFEITRDAAGRPAGFTLLSKRIGRGTAQLYDAHPGDRLACLGPLGRPFDVVSPPQEAWMVAGGVGLAPFATLGEALLRQGTPTTLFYGARTAADLHCSDAFARMGIEVVTATEDGSRGDRGLVTGPLERRLARHAEAKRAAVQIYACGPTPMMRAVAAAAAARRQPCLVSLEQVMGCGLGGCYSCVVAVRDGARPPHFVRSCLAGPVFESSAVVWEALGH